MRPWVSWLRVALEIVGAVCILMLLGRWAFHAAFKDFAGGICTDTEQHVIASPGGKHSIKIVHSVCGVQPVPGTDYRGWDDVYLSTGNPNPGYEYTQIADFPNIMPRLVNIRWDTSDQVSITYPPQAQVGNVYAKVLGIRVVLHPDMPEQPTPPSHP